MSPCRNPATSRLCIPCAHWRAIHRASRQNSLFRVDRYVSSVWPDNHSSSRYGGVALANTPQTLTTWSFVTLLPTSASFSSIRRAAGWSSLSARSCLSAYTSPVGCLRTCQTSANEPRPTILTRSKSGLCDGGEAAARAPRGRLREAAGAGEAEGIGGGSRRNGRNTTALCINLIGYSATAGQVSNLSEPILKRTARVRQVSNLSVMSVLLTTFQAGRQI